jgi:hypothetical protein
MLTPETLACALFLGVLLAAFATCVVGAMHQVAFAEQQARTLLGLRPL